MQRSIGVIADTHGLVRPEAVAALRGSEFIIHAGDIGTPEVLEALRRIAPVFAVRGNVDKGAWAESLPETRIVHAGDTSIYVLHNLNDLDLDPTATNVQAIISGHSHRPQMVEKNGVLYLNPGSAGPRRFTLPVAVGQLELVANQLRGTIIRLPV